MKYWEDVVKCTPRATRGQGTIENVVGMNRPFLGCLWDKRDFCMHVQYVGMYNYYLANDKLHLVLTTVEHICSCCYRCYHWLTTPVWHLGKIWRIKIRKDAVNSLLPWDSLQVTEPCPMIKVKQPTWTKCISHIILFNFQYGTNIRTPFLFSPLMCLYQ